MARSTRRIKRDSRNEERKTASRLGGRVTFNSGTGSEKGDGRVFGKYRIENKITDSKSYRLTGEEWQSLRMTALMAGETPLFAIRVPVLTTSFHTRLIVVAKADAEAILDCAVVAPPLNRGGATGAKGYTFSTKRWMKHGEVRGLIHVVLLDRRGARRPVVAMRWERFCALTGHT